MEIKELKRHLKDYSVNVSVIRALAAVSIDGMSDANMYEFNLIEDYKEISRLGQTCRKILSDTIYPLIRSKEHLSVDEVYVLQDFCDMLIDPANGTELDLSLLYEVSDRILYEFKFLSDDNNLARQLNMHVSICYANVTRTSRLTTESSICTFYRDRGLDAARIGLEMLHDKDRYMKMNNAGRIFLLRIARFYSAVYDTFYFEEETNYERYQALIDALKLAGDPFYHDSVTDYNWKLHQVRCLEHMGQLTESGNKWGFTVSQCREICSWLDKLKEHWEKDTKALSLILPEAHYELIMLRNSFFAEFIDADSYRTRLLELYEKYSNENYDMYSTQMNLLIPLEYIATLKGKKIDEKTNNTLRYLYDRVVDYIMKSVNLEGFNFLQGYLGDFLDCFIEIAGVMSFLDMGLNCMAALHPPTYVHSLQVADISVCLMEHLARRSPELIAGVMKNGKPDPMQISHICSEIYKCALCHDFGKIVMIDSIFMYGRELFDSEYDIIHLHTREGWHMLKKHDSTAQYAESAYMHHIWFDGSKGYPDNVDDIPSLFSCIIAVADAIDAANDDIGRSYRVGKSVDQIINEIQNNSGKRYASYVADMLNDKEVIDDIEYLLTEGRRNRYRTTYMLLSGLKDRKNI